MNETMSIIPINDKAGFRIVPPWMAGRILDSAPEDRGFAILTALVLRSFASQGSKTVDVTYKDLRDMASPYLSKRFIMDVVQWLWRIEAIWATGEVMGEDWSEVEARGRWTIIDGITFRAALAAAEEAGNQGGEVS